ncbi:MAG TPA: hypothetical protein PKD55_13840 [Bellilinea sp.]|nr:hypothetical protein [Bellilinea sp.]
MKRLLSSLLALGILLSLLGSTSSPVQAQTQYLYASPSGSYSENCAIETPCSLQKAVELSNSAAAEAETLIYLASGTYLADTTRWYPEVIRITNSVKIFGRCNFSSGSAVCTPENEPSSLDGQSVRRVIALQLANPEVIHLHDLNLVYGNGNELANECPSVGAGDSKGCGGAIISFTGSNNQNELKIENCVFQYNYGRLNTYPTAGEQGLGGAISLSNFGVARINNSKFDRNTAILDGNGYGGAIYSGDTQIIIQNTEFTRNRCTPYATFGQGCGVNIQAPTGVTEISGNTFEFNNTNTTDGMLRTGGAVYISTPDQINISSNAFYNNIGNSVVELWVKTGTTENLIAKNRFWGNLANVALNVNYSPSTTTTAIITVLNNFVGYQWGFDEDSYTTNGIQFTALSSGHLVAHLWHNSFACLDLGIHMVDLTDVDITDNIFGWSTEAARADSQYPHEGPIITGTSNLIHYTNSVDLPEDDLVIENPLFVDFMNGDLHITLDSPAINHAVNTGVSTDIDGDLRNVGLPDIGADEFVLRLFLPMLVK